MTDAEKHEKVVRGLTECVKGFGPKDCGECPYGVGDPRPCVFQLMRDALALIKEQKERIKRLLEAGKILSDALDEKGDSDAEVH